MVDRRLDEYIVTVRDGLEIGWFRIGTHGDARKCAALAHTLDRAVQRMVAENAERAV